jgi:hypothetical protein
VNANPIPPRHKDLAPRSFNSVPEILSCTPQPDVLANPPAQQKPSELKQRIDRTNAVFTLASKLQALNQHWAIAPTNPSHRFLRYTVQSHSISGIHRNARNSRSPRIVAEVCGLLLSAALYRREHNEDQWQF